MLTDRGYFVVSAATTSRALGKDEFQAVGSLIADVLDAVSVANVDAVPAVEARSREQVAALTRAFPIYPLV